MTQAVNKIKLVLGDVVLRRRILFTLLMLALFRLLAAIPLPAIDKARFAAYFSQNEFLGLLNLFSGGGLSNVSIILLGVGPYITASIIMQLLTIMSPKLKALYQEEGEAGRRKFTMYSRFLTVPLALIQALGFITLFKSQGIIGDLTGTPLFTSVVIMTAGSLLLMWIGELMTEFGIGNGVSVLIFAGIVSSLPSSILQFKSLFNVADIPTYIGLLILAVLVTAAVVVITEAERPIPVTYAKQVKGNKVYGGVSTYIPLRINQAGVIPIIFALSILLLPQMIVNFAGQFHAVWFDFIAKGVQYVIGNQVIYAILYFVLIFFSTYFYTAVTFDPEKIAENLQRSGAFIPGVRPGSPTVDYLGKVATRLTLFGALFLGVVAIVPLVIQNIPGMSFLAIGGTALLIVVSVVIDLLKKLDAQASMREY